MIYFYSPVCTGCSRKNVVASLMSWAQDKGLEVGMKDTRNSINRDQLADITDRQEAIYNQETDKYVVVSGNAALSDSQLVTLL